MAIFSRKSEVSDVYGSVSAASTLDKYIMPEKGMVPDVAYNLVKDELMLDGNAK
ncbi:hypothetical protein HRJ35_12440 [Shewanella oneidensis MR-1]|uniref:hypothetical protein n=1 Tax=Shewanella oneidensis TaxID=70863 RepID=UPI0002D9D38E|nr:hypothetical protein [Shewanella oneidensis]MDX5996127.1 hypothetical protein [Shewanella oneidensis]MEE2030337.1 hypothetical protein [Shewanella oneidensis]QKG96745.1 hypothetical protein HRJ35_12440 [Shewanella oneidensis MR-1]